MFSEFVSCSSSFIHDWSDFEYLFPCEIHSWKTCFSSGYCPICVTSYLMDCLCPTVLHGGPGAGCTDRHARFFDPQHYRIVLFDQRGCGKSKPRGCLEENTTGDLVADIEKLRVHLGETSSALLLCLPAYFGLSSTVFAY